MAESTSVTGELKPTLGLTGVTINAMALIAPGAFLWTTFEEQTASGAPSMWASVLVATIIALLTASCYAVFARKYPQAGAGSSYYYAEQAFLEKESHDHFKLARIAKLIVGIAAHLYYWVYPGVMVTFMGILIVFIGQLFNPNFATAIPMQCGICVVFAILVGCIAYIGVTGSTMANIIINIIQIVSLVAFSIGAIWYRSAHPGNVYEHFSAADVVGPHKPMDLLFQSTIAILLVVGFESATALAAEAKNPLKDIPRGVILSLIIQAVVFYLFEYFAANYFIGTQYAAVLDKNGANFAIVSPVPGIPLTDGMSTAPPFDPKTMTGVTAATYAGGTYVNGYAAASPDSAPIGNFVHIIGDAVKPGLGFDLEVIVALTVVLALIGTTLSCLNTAVRVSYAMGKDDELPGLFGALHGKFNTPHLGVILLTGISAAIGAYGVVNADHLLQITLISNLGTFLLYGLTCIACYVGFSHVQDANVMTTKVFPVIGAFLNFGLMGADFWFAFKSTTATAATIMDTKIALGVTFGFIIVSFVWLAMRSAAMKQPMFLPPDHKATIS